MAEGAALTLYTDGGANPNPGPGGWGVVAVSDDGVVRYELSGSAAQTTNNRMELTAAIEALDSLAEGTTAVVITDSQYLRQGITSWIDSWKRKNWMRGRAPKLEPVKNADLWKRLDALASRRSIDWRWTKGHAGNEYNERADQLATAEIERLSPQTSSAGSDTTATQEAKAGATIVVRCHRGSGQWAALLDSGDRKGREVIGGPLEHQTSANRLELAAALALLPRLQAIDAPAVEIRCGDYLRRGYTEWLTNWKRAGWRTASGEPVKNQDLWQRLDQSLPEHVGFSKIDSKADEVRDLKKQLREGIPASS